MLKHERSSGLRRRSAPWRWLQLVLCVVLLAAPFASHGADNAAPPCLAITVDVGAPPCLPAADTPVGTHCTGIGGCNLVTLIRGLSFHAPPAQGSAAQEPQPPVAGRDEAPLYPPPRESHRA